MSSRNTSTARQQTAKKQGLKERAAQTRDAIGRFLKRGAGQVTDQPQPASLPEGSSAERRDASFSAGGASQHDAGRGHADNLDRADAGHGRAPHREHDMGRHETFENATAITDHLLAGTVLGRTPQMVFPEPGSGEAKAAFAAACSEHSARTARLSDDPALARDGGHFWTRDRLGKALDSGELTPAEYARLYPLANERELCIETVAHELNLGSLFALAYADDYPVKNAAADALPGGTLAATLIEKHRAAYAAWEPHLDAIGTQKVNSPAYHAAEEAGEPARLAEVKAFADLIDARVTTLPDLAALASYLPEALRLNGMSDPEDEVRRALHSMCSGVLSLTEDAALDAELTRLGRRFEAARARELAACEDCTAAQREADRHKPERPACLTLRASDQPLCVYPEYMMAAAMEGIQPNGADIEWLRAKMPMTHEILRPVREGERAHVDFPGRKRDIAPYPEAQARAEEIVGAWDAWRAQCMRVDDEYLPDALAEAADVAGDEAAALAEQIAAISARTPEGFRVKLRALSHYMRNALQSEAPDDPDPDQILAHSLWRDVQGETAPAADPTDWHSPPAGFMAFPALEPIGFTRIPHGIQIELERLHNIALVEFQRRTANLRERVGEAAMREREAKIRADLFLLPLTAAVDPDSDGARALAALDQAQAADPVFAAIEASRRAEAAMEACEREIKGDVTPEQRAREDECSAAQSAAMSAALRTVPTTHAGRLALVNFAEFQSRLCYGDDWQATAQNDVFGEIAEALKAAIRAEQAEVPFDLRDASISQLARFHDHLLTLVHIATLACHAPMAMDDKGERSTVVGSLLEDELERLDKLSARVADVIRTRAPADADEHSDRLTTLTKYQMTLTPGIEDQALVAEINAAWGSPAP